MADRNLKASVIIGGSISGAFRSALGTTRDGLQRIGEAIASVERRQRLLATQIDTFGRMGKNVTSMRVEYAALVREADRLRLAHERLALAQSRVQANRDRRQDLGGKLRGAVTTVGAAVVGSLFPIRAATEFESAMLGVAKQVEGARDSAGNLTSVYFDMVGQVRALGRDVPIATNDIADMVAAGARMGVARGELIDFTRTAAMMADAFELPAGQLADDMGKIAGLFHIPIPRIGELADAINYLDDNAISKGGDIIDVMRRIGGMAQTIGMSAKDSAALASTFLTLGSSAEVAGTASNALLRILGAATAQSKKVQGGFKDIGMSAAGVQAAMAKDPTGTILRVLNALNRLNAEQRVVAATRMFGAEYGDDIAKLATGADEYRRQLALANGEAARGSMSREFQARLKTTAAQWQITKNRLQEVSVTIGGALLPAINELFKTVAPTVEKFAEWARQNPELVKGIIGGALALGGLRLATLAAGYAWTVVKTPILSTMEYIARWRAGGAIAALGNVGTAVRAVGVAALGISAPVALAIGALVAGAIIVRKYWEPIRAFVVGVFEGLSETVGPVFAALGQALAPLKPIWDGIASTIGTVWNWFTRLLVPVQATADQLDRATNAGRAFGRVLGNAVQFAMNPGRAIAGLFSNDEEGAAPGTARGRPAPAMPSAAPRTAGGTNVTQQNTFHVTQLPGESGEAFARRVAELTKQREGVARRGSLIDEAA